MKFITDINELKGKTIQSACLLDCEEELIIVFNDYSCIRVDVGFCGDSHSLELMDSAPDYIKRDSGIITQKEYNAIRAGKEEVRIDRERSHELSILAQLKKKYE